MARTAPRPPISILAAIVVSLPLFPYTWHMLLHILGAVLFLGNLLVTGAWMTWAVGQKDSRVAAFASAGVNKADRWFTSPGMILLLLNGLAMTALAWGGWLGFTISPNRWIFVGLTLLIATGALYGAVIRRYQNQMVRISSETAKTGAPLPEDFSAVFRKWSLWGVVATILPLIALYFMVASPLSRATRPRRTHGDTRLSGSGGRRPGRWNKPTPRHPGAMKAAKLLVSCLENEKVRFAFGIPGEENLELMDSLRDSSIRFVLTRHEEAAAFMADVQGRLTTHAGVCIATLGPGATNLVTGVADAFLDRAPLVAITAQANLSRVHRESHQFVDILQLFHPITKWNARIENPDTVPEIVRKAFKLAEAEKPGSTHIELPENIADEEAGANAKPLPIERVRSPSPDRASLEKAAELIQKADRPLVLAGNGVIRSGASEELRRFAEDLRIPVAHTFMGKGTMPWTSPMNLFTIGVLPRDYELAGLDESDLVICVGFDFVEYDPRSWNPRGDRRIVHIDSLPAEISVQYVPEVEVVGEIRESLRVLHKRVQRPRESAWALESRERVLKRLESEIGERSKGAMKPQRIIWELRDILGPDDLLISDVGAHKLWLGRFFRTMKPNTVIISNGLSAMGIALPGGIAAKLLDPDRRVVTLSGDGGFLMSVHELETAKRERTATVNLVFRDGGLGSIKWKQVAKFGRTVGTEFHNPDFTALAGAFGIQGFRVDDPSELSAIVREAMESKAATVVDIPVDYSDNPFLAQGS